MLKTGILLLAVAAAISIVLGAAFSLQYAEKEMVSCQQKENCELKKIEPQVSAGCSQVVWQGSEVELRASAKNIENPAYVWLAGDEVLGTERDLIYVFDLGEHTIKLDVSFCDNNGTENKTLSASMKVIVIDSLEQISVDSTAGVMPTERTFQTTYLGNNLMIKGVRIDVDGIEYDKMQGCGRISVTELTPGEHRWNATYRGVIIANGSFSVADIIGLKIKGASIEPVYHVGEMVDAKLTVQNTGTTLINKFVVHVRIVNHKYEWMGEIAKYEYSIEYTDELPPGQKMDIPVRAKIPEKVGMVKPTGDYSIIIELVINGQVIDSKTMKTEII
jgi:hypothetical protein